MSELELEKKAQKIWDKWRKKEIDSSEVHRRLDLLFGVETRFIKEVSGVLSELAQSKINQKSKEYYNAKRYFSKLEDAIEDVIKNNTWFKFWENCEWLEFPTQEDIQYIPFLSDFKLSNVYGIIIYSLKQLSENDQEDTEQANILHEYYLLLKNEINSRHTMFRLPQVDAFLDYSKSKKEYREQKNREEGARKTGEMCVFCGSENVRSYNRIEWKCYSCNKRFRKN